MFIRGSDTLVRDSRFTRDIVRGKVVFKKQTKKKQKKYTKRKRKVTLKLKRDIQKEKEK